MNEQANNVPSAIQDFLGGLAPEATEPTTSKQAKINLKTQEGLAAAFKAGKLSEDMLDIHNEDHHEWINKCREAEAKVPVWLRPKPNDNEFFGDSLYIGVNGKDYYLPVNRWSKVPKHVWMQLQTCTKVTQLQEDESQHLGKFIASVEVERFPYDVSEAQPKLGAKDKPIVEFC